MPKKIEIQLRSKKHIELVDNMPTLAQIQNYVKYRRQLQGDNNLLDDVKDYVNSKHYKSYKGDDSEMFFFGEKFGNGSDYNHF